MTLSIKNMVCERCVMTVQRILSELGYNDAQVTIGNATLQQTLSPEQLHEIDEHLQAVGFELLLDQDAALVERIKTAVIFLARQDADSALASTTLSQYLSEQFARSYKALSTLFSEREGRTIERFYIVHKVERVKELLDYGTMSISEIAYKTAYSSVAHLSRQFKQVTGLTPSQYKSQSAMRHGALDKL